MSLLRFRSTQNLGSHAVVTYPRKICQRTNTEDPRIGKVTKQAKYTYFSNNMAVPLQTWLIGSTISDMLIAASMLYYVNLFYPA